MTLADLEAMDRTALSAAWTRVFGIAVPKGLSRPLMRRFLATELQARQQGGLPRKVKAALLRGPEVRGQKRGPKHPGLKPGGRLIRDWNGVTHLVEVTGDGFLWNGARYRSLSVIARAITGAHWSGPRFFGLTGARGR